MGGFEQTTYNVAGFALEFTDSMGRVTTTTRDVQNRPVRVDHPDGSFEEWTYNSFGQALTHRRADGGVAAYSFYESGELGGFPQDMKSETDTLGTTTFYTYADSGLVASIQDRRGYLTQFTYDWRGNVIDTEYADGSVASQVWDEWGNRIAEIDELGQATVYDYTEFNQVASITDAFAQTTSFGYGTSPDCGSCGYQLTLVRETHPSGRETTHSYDRRGKRISTTVGAGTGFAATSTFSYDAVGNLVGTTDPLGRNSLDVYDLNKRRTEQINALDETTRWTYDAAGNVLSETRPSGATTELEYDALDRAYRVVDPLGGATIRAFDPLGRVTQVTDPLGRTITTDYDSEGRAVKVTAADGTYRSLEYDESGNLVRLIDELGGQTGFSYDSRGRQISSSDPLGSIRFTEYDSAGRVTAEVSPAGRRIDYGYDETNRRIAITLGAGTEDAASTDFTYDSDGRLVSTTDAEGVTQIYVYDLLGRKVESIDGLLHRTRYRYDLAGNLLETTRPDGTILAWTYDPLNRIASETNAAGQRTSYHYTVSGQLGTVVDARGSTTTMAYDVAARMISKTYADGNGDVFEYDLAGRLTSRTTARGLQASYGYTANDQLSSVHYSDGTPATTSAYDPKGRLVARGQGGASQSFVYDAADQLISTSQSVPGHPLGSRTLDFTYDVDGLRRSLIYPDGSALDYEYNARGQLANLARGNAVLASYSYRLNGSLARRDLGNGAFELRTYDAAEQLTATQTRNANGGVLAKALYQLNDLGLREGIDRGFGEVESYAYNLADELVAATYAPTLESAYDYDAAGNRVASLEDRAGSTESLDYITNALNQYTLIEGSTVELPAYDADGNATAMRGLAFSYDGQNQLVSAVPLEPEVGSVRLFNDYDASGRRVRQTEQSYLGSSGWVAERVTYYVYDAWNVVEETTVGEAPRRYVWGDDLSGASQGAGGVGGLVLAESTGDEWWYHYDGNGNVVALSDAAGSKIADYRYSAFGETLSATGPAAEANSYRFSSKPTDELGLLYYGLRFYTPELGRWLNRDPIGESGGSNLYAFVGNESVERVDRLGLDTYAIDGTYANVYEANPKFTSTNVHDFFSRSKELRSYFPGPGVTAQTHRRGGKVFNGATGWETYLIVKQVLDQICADRAAAAQAGREFKINLVGWSRGATAAAWVARELGETNCGCEGSGSQPIEVNFLGLYDAVEMIPAGPLTPGHRLPEWYPGDQGPPNSVPDNVRNFFHATKTGGAFIRSGGIPLPTTHFGHRDEHSFSLMTPWWDSEGGLHYKSDHSQVGTSPDATAAHAAMLRAAADAGVPLDTSNSFTHLPRP